MVQLQGYYQDVLVVICVYFQSRGGSTVLTTITGCVVSQLTSKVNWKTGILTSCRSETPENFITTIRHFDLSAIYVMRCNTHASQFLRESAQGRAVVGF